MNKEKISKRYSFIFIVRSFVRSFANFQKKINKQRLLIPTLATLIRTFPSSLNLGFP